MQFVKGTTCTTYQFTQDPRKVTYHVEVMREASAKRLRRDVSFDTSHV